MPGWTLPGVMTTGALQTLVRAQRVCPGERVLIGGTGPLNLQLACELVACGVKPVAVVEAAPRPGACGVARPLADGAACTRSGARGMAMLGTLKRAGVPVLWSARVTEVRDVGDGHETFPLPLREGVRGRGGSERPSERPLPLTLVRFAAQALNGRGNLPPPPSRVALVAGAHGDRTFDVDVVALNLGFQPEVGLARALGIPHRFVDVGLGHLATETDADGRTAIASVFAVGDGAVLGGARVAMARGRLAGWRRRAIWGWHGAGRPCGTRGAGACAAIPGRAVAGVPAAAASAGSLPTQPSCAAARRSPPGGCAPNSPAG